MKIKENESEYKEVDKYIFKVLLRCMKEKKNSPRNFFPWERIISDCYRSRRNHTHEALLVNVGYWPGDCQLGFDYSDYILFLAMLANGQGFEKLPGWETIKQRFTSYINPQNVPIEKIDKVLSYDNIIKDAVKIMYGEDNADDIMDAFKMSLMGIKKGLPL
jgi:hypothetical protein